MSMYQSMTPGMTSYILNEGTEHELTIRYYLNQKPNLKAELEQTEMLNHQLLSYKLQKDPSKEIEIDQTIGELATLKADTKANHQGDFFSTSCKHSTTRCSQFMDQWGRESISTIYWLRFISYSVVRVKKQAIQVILSKWDDSWENCTKTFLFPDKTKRVIMGIGPSGCGKSTIAKTIFPWFTDIETVVFIDGGISREVSTVWNVATAFSNGISDLYKLFKTYNSKDKLFDMLKSYPCSFYIPDTLSNAQTVKNYGLYRTTGINYMPDIKQYTVLDKNWIALLIWQHLNSPTSTCTYATKGYQCVGCDVSGLKRQVSEGKIYDSNAYNVSMHASLLALKQSKHQFFIHNSGSRNIKTVLAYQSDVITPQITALHPNIVMLRNDNMSKSSFEQINTVILATLAPAVPVENEPQSESTDKIAETEPDNPLIQLKSTLLEIQQPQLKVLDSIQRKVDELIQFKSTLQPQLDVLNSIQRKVDELAQKNEVSLPQKKTWKTFWRGGLKKTKKYNRKYSMRKMNKI